MCVWTQTIKKKLSEAVMSKIAVMSRIPRQMGPVPSAERPRSGLKVTVF